MHVHAGAQNFEVRWWAQGAVSCGTCGLGLVLLSELLQGEGLLLWSGLSCPASWTLEVARARHLHPTGLLSPLGEICIDHIGPCGLVF